MVKGRKPWIAGILTFFHPGLGHVYAGELRKGIVIAAAITPAIYLMLVTVFLNIKASAAIIITIACSLITYIVLISSAVRLAKAGGSEYVLKPFNKWYVYVGLIALGGFVYQPLIGHFVKSYYLQAFKIPAGSMAPSLIIGDHILVNKGIYRKQKPQRWDVVVFKFPQDQETDFIKRIVALPGEELTLTGNALYINGIEIEDVFAYFDKSGRSELGDIVSFRVPAKGDAFSLDDDNVKLYKYLIANEVRDRGSVVDGRLLIDGKPVSTYTVENDYYFVMGDNRNNSYDSRFWGPVSEGDISGKAFSIYWSMSRDDGIKIDRVGLPVE